MNKYDPLEIRDRRASDLLSDPQLARWVEGYAAACADLMEALSGDTRCGKSYDPMVIDPQDGEMHSYAFDMKDGGRHHPIADYETISEIAEALRDEAVQWIRESDE